MATSTPTGRRARGTRSARSTTRSAAARGSASPAAAAPTLTHAEFAERRQRLLAELKNAVGLVPAGEADPSLHGEYRSHPHFEYLTGITDEPGAMLLLDPTNPVPARRATLLLRPLNPEIEKWDGFRHEMGAALRDRTGFSTVMRTTALPKLLLESARRARRLATLLPNATYNAPVPQDLQILRAQAERLPGCVVEDGSDLLVHMRASKSAAEVACIEHAGRITTAGFMAALRGARAGMDEFQLQEMVEHAYRTNGARNLAFRTIAGGGFNATVLHYHANDQPLVEGQLLVLDSGARWNGYSADVTRTIPIGGRFNARQRELYELVLKSQLAAIAACKVGATIAQIDAAARGVIAKAGYGDWFIHGIGHHLGLETHDASPDAPLREGAVITIEPGIYLPKESLGIRIEDDVAITRRGPRVLTPDIPKTVADVERAMRG
ncbi:MAG: Xaa-Pro peptidase family protein [Phycisphaerales bacterium]